MDWAGKGVAKNAEEAYFWASLAAAGKDPVSAEVASKGLADMAANLAPEQIELTCVKVGVVFGVTVIIIDAVVAH